MTKKNRTLRIALSIELNSTFGRRMVNGIISFVRKRPRWRIEVRREQPYLTPEELLTWEGDGIIAQIYDENVASQLTGRDIPLVNTSSRGFSQEFPSVSVDNYRLGELAAEHLIGKKLKEFAYIQFPGTRFGGLRYRGFAETLKTHGCRCSFHEVSQESNHGRMDAESYIYVLKDLPRPVGVFAFNDRVGFGILEACRELNISVPDELSLVGVDNDETLCVLSYAQMTSIDPAATEIGYRAAELLDSLLKGDAPPRHPVLIEPEGLIERESSDALSVSDPVVAEALRFIRNHDSESIHVSDVVMALPVGRRALERRFRDEMERSVYDEIRRTRIERAKDLLKETDMSVISISRASGFNTIQRFEACFKDHTGMTASAYRSKA